MIIDIILGYLGIGLVWYLYLSHTTSNYLSFDIFVLSIFWPWDMKITAERAAIEDEIRHQAWLKQHDKRMKKLMETLGEENE